MNPLRTCRRLSPPLACALFAASAAGALAPPATVSPKAAAAPAAAAAETAGGRRVELPGMEGKPFPYTVELPEGWKVHAAEGSAGLWLGPADAVPGKDPRMVYVRISPASLADPEAVAANIRASDAAQSEWSAPTVEVREVGGVRGVLVQMDRGEGAEARSTLALKLPLAKTSVDFLGSAKRAEFAALRPSYEQVLFSVRPLDVPTPGAPVRQPAGPSAGQSASRPASQPAKPPGR